MQRAYSPVDLLLTDPAGRRSGTTDGGWVLEIPQTLYTGAGSDDEFILVYRPMVGMYSAQAGGTGTGTYDLLYGHLARQMSPRTQTELVEGVSITLGDVHVYQTEVPPFALFIPLTLAHRVP